MEKQLLDEKIIEVISDKANCVNETDGFVGDKIYKIGLYYAENKNGKHEYYLAATEDNTLATIRTIRENLDDNSAANMCKDIIKRESDCLNDVGEKVTLVEVEDEVLNQPVLVKLVLSEKLDKTSNRIKMFSNELIDWLDELTVMKTAKVSAKEVENYQQEYEKIMSANLIPHEEEEVKDYTSTMAIFSMICAIISIFLYSMCVMPVITVVTSLFSGYRCYTNKNNKALVVCAAAFIVGAIFTYVGWNAFKGSMHIN